MCITEMVGGKMEQFRPTLDSPFGGLSDEQKAENKAMNEKIISSRDRRMAGGRRSSPAPGQKTAAPEYETEHTSKVQGKPGYQDEGQRKKALEVRKKKEGVKEFAPIDEKTMPELPDSGISAP